MAEKKAKKEKKTTTTYNIIKKNGRTIQRTNLDDLMIKRYKSKGWKVEEV